MTGNKGWAKENRVETRGRLPTDPVERTLVAMRRDLARLGVFVHGVQGRFLEECDGAVSDSLRADSRAQRRMLALVVQQAYGGFEAFPDVEAVTLARVRHFYLPGGVPKRVSSVPRELVPGGVS